jgi:2-polyprenyl-3-methyl-5-hydroxy-6-metoxy-1,4-benzoquinol methylase
MRPQQDTLLVWTGAPCSYGCAACPIDRERADPGLRVFELQQHLAALPAIEGRLAVLVGGEPFLRPDFHRLVAALRAGGCVPGLVSTGRPLIYPKVREQLRRLGLAYLRVQLFGFGDAHDRVTAVAGGFSQALAGLRAWIAEAGTQCDVDVALSTRGRPVEAVVSEIEPLAQELAASGVQIVVAIDPAGRAELEGSASLRDAVAAFAHWNDAASAPLLAWEGVPESIASACGFAIAPLRPAFVGGTAQRCCLGALDVEPSATHEAARANSFNFVRGDIAVPLTETADTCTAHRSAHELDPQRQLWLIDGDQLVLYTTDTGDFDAPEIARIKDGLSHLFVDRAPAGVLDDFTEGMRRVLPDAICDTCAHRQRCGRRFRVVEGPPFAREEAWIADYVGRLRGRVLDVGCGEQLYRDVLAPLIRNGVVQYTGIDPDEPSLAVARAALPEGRFIAGGIEDFRGQAASYDHILCLRSLNHVADLDEAVARMSTLLKPGGSLLMVETTPFAMLRRPEQVAAADRAPRAGHQHFRNLASEDVLPYARRRSLQVREHHPATLSATNEWILLLQRAPVALA